MVSQFSLTKLQQKNHSLQAELTKLHSRYESLQKSEARYRQAFENAPISMLFISSEGKPIEMNSAAEQFLGWTIAEANETGFNGFTETTLLENGTISSFEKAISGETVIEPPMYFDPGSTIGQGQWKWAQGHYYPIRDAAGQVQEVVEVALDLTAMYKVQQKLAQERTSLLQASAQVANLLLRASDYTTVLPDVVRLLGEAVGSDRCGVLRNTFDQKLKTPATQILAEWCNSSISYSVEATPELEQGFLWDYVSEYRDELAQGKIANLLTASLRETARSIFEQQGTTSMLIVPILFNEKFWGIISFDNCGEPRLYDEAEIASLQVAAESLAAAIARQAKDEELRESERRYRTLFELSSEGILRFGYHQPIPLSLSVDEQLELCYESVYIAESNAAFARMYEYEKTEDMIGLTLNDLHDCNSEVTQATMRAYVEDKHSARNTETVELDRYGRKRYFLNSSVSTIENNCVVSTWVSQVDITELREAQQELLEVEQKRSQELERHNIELQQILTRLEERDRILVATATATNALLTARNLDEAVHAALETMGESLETDRIKVLENFFDEPSCRLSGYHNVIYEWTRPNTVCQMSHQAGQISTKGLESFIEALLQNNGFGGLVDEWIEPLRSAFKTLEVKSTYCVPIRVEGEWWGVLAFDDCREAKHRSQGEMAVLNTVADCIGSSIQRDRTQKAILKAEQERSQQLENLNIELQQTVDSLENRDRILAATAEASNILLTGKDFDKSVNQALQIISESINTDRIGIIENFDNPEDPLYLYWKMTYEWNSAYAVSQLNDLEVLQGSYEGIEEWDELLTQGESISCQLEELSEPFRSEMAKIGVKTLYVVPILIEGKYWGSIGIDDCREETHRSEAELSILKTAAACIGSAIQRDRTQKAILKAEQERSQQLESLNIELQQTVDSLENRDRILAATAEASNILLTGKDFDKSVNQALQIIGESINTDRISIVESFENPEEPLHLYWKITYEWDSAYTVSQLNHPDVSQGSYEGIEEWYELLTQGESISRQLAELSEPFRSGQAKIGLKTLYVVPILIEGKYWGSIGIDDCREETHRSEAELSILKTAAACIGSAIQRDRTQKAILKTEQERVAELAKTNQALKKSLDRLADEPALDAFLGHVLTETSQQLQLDFGYLFFYNKSDLTLDLHMFVTSEGAKLKHQLEKTSPFCQTFSVGDLPIWDTLLQTRKPFIIDRQNAEQYVFKGTLEWQSQQQEHHTGINILLTLGDQPIGLLALVSTKCCFTPQEVELAQALSQQVTLAIQLTRLAEETKQSAIFEERNRLAGEIHDTLAQTFTGISVQLELAQYFNPHNSTEVKSILERISSLAQTGLSEARRSVWSVYSAGEKYADLAQELADCVEHLTLGTDLNTEVNIDGNPYSLSCLISKNLLRIGQEAITNTLKHAQASEIQVKLTYTPNQVSLCISDNGCGFCPQNQTEGFGLIGISERTDRIGGQLRITTQSGQGTEIFVQVSL